MDNVKNDNYYINRLREDVAFIVKNMKDVSEPDATLKVDTEG